MSAYQWSAFASLCGFLLGTSAMWQYARNEIHEQHRWAEGGLTVLNVPPPVPSCGDEPADYDG